MRYYEIITERMETAWVQPWVTAAVNKIGAYKNNTEWYKKFFKNINAAKEFKQWQKVNISDPVSIESKIIDDDESTDSLIDASHILYNPPLEHKVILTINVANAPTDSKSTAEFINRASSFLVHELSHAQQREKQLRKANDPDAVMDLDTTIWAKNPPSPMTARDKHYIYMLDNIEKDAWTAQTANDIHNALGSDSIQYLSNILKQVQVHDHAVVKSKIIQLPGLKNMYDAIKYYGSYLKGGKDVAWQKVKKELYGYLSRR